jgi:hypothetical protein
VVRESVSSLTTAHTTHRNLNGILAAVMLEHGISHETLPKQTNLRGLKTFMKDYGNGRMEGDRIIGYLKKLDDVMKRVPISKSIQRGLSLVSSQRKRVNVLSIGECAPLLWTLPS